MCEVVDTVERESGRTWTRRPTTGGTHRFAVGMRDPRRMSDGSSEPPARAPTRGREERGGTRESQPDAVERLVEVSRDLAIGCALEGSAASNWAEGPGRRGQHSTSRGGGRLQGRARRLAPFTPADLIPSTPTTPPPRPRAATHDPLATRRDNHQPQRAHRPHRYRRPAASRPDASLVGGPSRRWANVQGFAVATPDSTRRRRGGAASRHPFKCGSVPVRDQPGKAQGDQAPGRGAAW